VKYADVIIDIASPSLDRTFQYRIPEALSRKIVVGSTVEIPFGTMKSLKRGYVMSISETPAIEEERIKDIENVLTSSALVESQLVGLAAFISKNYGSTLAAALRVVFPVRKKIQRKEKKYLHIKGDEALWHSKIEYFENKHQVARLRLLRELMLQQEIPQDIAVSKLNVTKSVITALVEQGLCGLDSERVYRNPFEERAQEDNRPQLLNEQKQALEGIITDFDKGELGTALIHGITGSGKTEVYISLAEEMVKRGLQVIVLIPEISLTYQTVMRFYNRFKDRVSTMHSRLSDGEKYDQFERAKNGELDVMVGPRSALFTPFSRLGMIIIDEEHESSYKSSQMPRYHAREVAIYRAAMCNAKVVLGSATPSVDSYFNAKQGIYKLYELTERAAGKSLAQVSIVDLRKELSAGNRSPFSALLTEKIKGCLERKEQSMLFLNRRGYAGFVSCRQCGYVFRCQHCDVTLSGHRNGMLRCHYCGYEQAYKKECPECGSKFIGVMKAGTQAIEKAAQMAFPEARILRMDMDTTKGKNDHEKILTAFAEGEADILIGTQMIVKGHDFPNVTLMGILAADMSLYVSDHRAGEHTFQLLTQAAGRSGRAGKKGEVIIQTYSPEDPYILAAASQDYKAFYEREIAYRSIMQYPPASHMMCVLFEDADQKGVKAAAEFYAKKARDIAQQFQEETAVMVNGPTAAAIAYINDIYREVVYIKSEDYSILTQIKDCFETEEKRCSRIQFDFDP